MNTKLLISVITAALFPLAAYAHDCSGGADGGMDATGNQCTRETVATVGSSDRAISTPTDLTKVEANKTATCTKCATKSRDATRNASAHPRVKHG